MANDTVYLFTRFGMGHGPEDLQKVLVRKFLTLALESGDLPAKILFYTDGVRLACEGSPALDLLQQFKDQHVEMVLCKTCLDAFGLSGQVKVGVVGGMGDILQVLQQAPKVISL